MITISPGHYGKGTGAASFIDEVTEAIKVAKRITEILRDSGITTNYIQDQVSKNQRDNINWLITQHNKTVREIDVSIHFNASAGTHNRGIGTETLIYNGKNQDTAQAISKAISDASGLRNRGVKIRSDIGILKHTLKPCYLIEVCFVNDSVDVALYKRDYEKICQAIAAELAQAVGKKLKVKNATEEDQIMELLNDTGRAEIRELLKKARGRKIITDVHTDEKISKYQDRELISYFSAVVNRTFK